MEFKILRNPTEISADSGYLRRILSSEPAASIMLQDIYRNSLNSQFGDVVVAIPEQWQCRTERGPALKHYNSMGTMSIDIMDSTEEWSVISNGRFVTTVNNKLLQKTIDNIDVPVIAVNIIPSMSAYTEQTRLTPDGRVVGLRRIYEDNAQPAYTSTNWPHHLFVRTETIRNFKNPELEMLDFRKFATQLKDWDLKLTAIDIAGSVLDLETEEGLLSLITRSVESNGKYDLLSASIDAGARIFGNVVIGRGVKIAQNAIIAGPAVLGNNVTVERGAVVDKSVVLSGLIIPEKAVLRSQLVTDNSISAGEYKRCVVRNMTYNNSCDRHKHDFRRWPCLSYPRFLKRVFDVIFSLIILTLFLPAFFILGIIIKLTSKGPVFYSARRQGLGGKAFGCLKFRSMMTCAEEMQEQLRFVNQVDGPQFKMENDPRVTAVGRFLRATSIDEIPQFINVLVGQMSIVGPRPSPDIENQSCPRWRQARLSVRPGITGLWQISRTREESKDFQEWLHYDVEYVKHVSFMFDVQIAFKTAQKLINDFVDQF